MSVGGGVAIQRPEDVASVGLAKLGIFGDNGAGKTTFLSTIPPELPTLVVSADEENVDQLRGLPHVRVYKIKEWGELPALLMFLAKSPKNPFKVLAFDTWTRMQVLATNQVVGYRVRDANEAMKFVTQIPRTPKGYEAWQNVGALAAEWMRYFERLPMHVVFLMQMMNRRENRDDPDDEGKLGPALTPFALRAAKESLKMIGHLYVDLESSDGGTNELSIDIEKRVRSSDIDPNAKEIRRLLVGPHPRYATKGPTHKVGYVVENPTWEKLAPAWDI